MKKLILSIIFILSATFAFAQVTLSPATFTAEDEVTITLNVSGTPLAGLNDIYIWAFSNDGVGGGKDALTNGQWGNSADAAKMTKTGTNIFTFKFTGTTLFGQSPAELINFGFLAKTKDGTKQTQDYKPYKFDPLVFVPMQFRVFPSKMDQTDMTTVYFHQDLATDQNLQRMFDVKVNLVFYNDATPVPAVVATRTALVTVKESNILYSYSFIPERLITLTAGTKLTKFTYQFTGSVKDANGANVPVAGPVTEVVYTPFN
ncbi:hypothetical protein VRU48_07995 [Pedobacter sp. KR3-3]|uniref:SbsA Ig-like domain-containing protein n=1 Tax=Pedobacter albus TaxID=3113905 RepID=A0ABU7I6D8_9SPHI|nr:hypothetical protein [Pedobacter sp. KR3-3]MEE1945044.1 hypothetical protein [Pedobacter sp. KR3-3]